MMKTETTTTYRIESIDRLNCSVNGNPRYRFGLTELDQWETFQLADLQSDSSFGYEVGNPAYRVGDTVTVEFTKAGRVRNMKAAS